MGRYNSLSRAGARVAAIGLIKHIEATLADQIPRSSKYDICDDNPFRKGA